MEVLLMKSSACGDCSSCGGCETKLVSMDLDNTIGGKVGDIIEVKMDEKQVLKGTAIMYVLPLLGLLLGVVLAHIYQIKYLGEVNDLMDFGVGLIFLLLTWIIVSKIDKKFNANQYVKVNKL